MGGKIIEFDTAAVFGTEAPIGGFTLLRSEQSSCTLRDWSHSPNELSSPSHSDKEIPQQPTLSCFFRNWVRALGLAKR